MCGSLCVKKPIPNSFPLIAKSSRPITGTWTLRLLMFFPCANQLLTALTIFRVEVISKDGVAPIAPYFPDPPVFVAGPEFRQMLLHKCTSPYESPASDNDLRYNLACLLMCAVINAENAAYHAPAFVSKMKAARRVIFSHLIKEYKK